MQKATPLLLILILAATASFLSIKKSPQPQSHPVATSDVVKAPPAAAVPPVPQADVPPQAPVATPTASAPTSDARVATAPAKPWPQAASDIPVEKAATFGSLPNGMRYIIYPNSEPPQRVAIRLHIAAGSLMEADDQQGLAHFMEHMVFNGSKHYAAADLVPRMQRLGIAFGAHANAYTSFDETVYMLDLPDLSAETMKLAFDVMRDFGDGALIAPEEIDRERGVILSEKTSRDSVQSRLMEQQFARLLPESLLTRRFPIGKEEVIQKAPRERFFDFYNRYYTPERMTMVIVGDIDPAVMKAKIEESFASMTNPAEAGQNPTMGPITQPEGIVTSVFADKEVGSTEVSLTLLRPHKEKPDTTANRIEKLPLALANAILSRRFERLTKVEDSAIASGSASNSELFNYLDYGSIDVTAADDRWREAVPVLEQEFRRAMQHGFTQVELDEAKSNLLNLYEQAVKQRPSMKSETLATAIARELNENTVLTTPETDLEIVQKGLATLDAASCHAAFRKYWEAPGFHLILTTKEKPENGEKDLAAIYQESSGKPVAPPSARAVALFGYTEFGRAGTVDTRKEVADLGITQLILSNRIRVNLKPTSFEKNKIRLLARIGTGKLNQPKDKPMLDEFATAVFEGGGLGKHSNDDLQQILAGKNVGTNFTVAEDAFTLSGSTTPADLKLQLQLMCATLIDPGYRKEGLWQFQKSIPVLYQRINHTPDGAEKESDAWLHGGDFRYTIAPVEKLTSYTLEDARKWLTPELTKGYLELTLVGDFEIETVLPELLSTFGALPRRQAAPVIPDRVRVVKFPTAPGSQSFTFDSKIPQGIATTVWKTEGLRGNLRQFRRLNILAEIYGDRLREEIRERLGASYSPNAGATGSDALNGFGYLVGQSVGKPADVDQLLATMREIADKLANEGATQDELDRALNPTLGQLDRSLRDNGYWIGTVMSQSQLDPDRLDLARTRDADYRSIKIEEINALAKKYFKADNALLISIKPTE